MRIASFLSSATEIVFELGLGDLLVGISHECDYPPQAMDLPRLSRSRFDPTGLDSGEVDREVHRCMEEYGSVYEVDIDRLREVRPDLILTQAVCEVCAVPTGSVDAAIEHLPYRPRVISLDAHTLGGIFGTIQQVADATGHEERGRAVTSQLRGRVDRVRERIADASSREGDSHNRPGVLALEWLDPPFVPGHWIPEMVEAAGADSLAGTVGARSEAAGWEDLSDTSPDHLLLLPCGYGLDEARRDANRHRQRLDAVAGHAIENGRAWIGHSAYFSRSGPRVVAGIEALAAAFHPVLFPTVFLEGQLESWG